MTVDNAKNQVQNQAQNQAQNHAQKLVDDYIHQFEEGYWPPLAMFASLVEEVGELAKEINHLEQVKPKKTTDRTELDMELGDILFSLICIANYYQINLDDALARVVDKYNTRDSDRWTMKDQGKGKGNDNDNDNDKKKNEDTK